MPYYIYSMPCTDLLKVGSDNNVSFSYESMNSLSLIPTISKPARITDDSYSLVNNIFYTNQTFFKTGILTFDISDHFYIFNIYENVFQNISHIETIQYRLINEPAVNNSIDKLQNVYHDE